MTPLDQARVAMRVAGNGGAAPTRLFLNTLPPGYEIPSSALLGAKQVFSAGRPSGRHRHCRALPPTKKAARKAQLRLGFVAGRRGSSRSQVDQTGTLR